MMEVLREEVLKKYIENRTQDNRESVILAYLYLVQILSNKMFIKLGNKVERDELYSFGVIGLIDAVDRFDGDKNVKFETYATYRINGSMLDGVRKLDWAPRSLRTFERDMNNAIFEFERVEGRIPSDDELSEVLGVSKEELVEKKHSVYISDVQSFEKFKYDDENDSIIERIIDEKATLPEQECIQLVIKDIIKNSFNVLTEKERQVISLYYYEDITFEEISKILGVTAPRISQLHSSALKKIGKELKNGKELLAFF